MAKFVELQLEGFDELRSRLDPKTFNRRLKKNIRRATLKNGLVAEGAIKTAMASGAFQKNSPLTISIKGSARPLVDNGDLMKAVSHKLVAFDHIVIGVLKSQKKQNPNTGKADDLLQIAALLHNGVTVSVTPRMRRFFFRMADLQPGRWKPLKATTKVIVIPPRPFLLAALEAVMIQRYEKNWSDAVDRALAGLDS